MFHTGEKEEDKIKKKKRPLKNKKIKATPVANKTPVQYVCSIPKVAYVSVFKSLNQILGAGTLLLGPDTLSTQASNDV